MIVCPNCGFKGEKKNKKDGNVLITIFLCLIFLPFGILYSLYRLKSKRSTCPECGYEFL